MGLKGYGVENHFREIFRQMRIEKDQSQQTITTTPDLNTAEFHGGLSFEKSSMGAVGPAVLHSKYCSRVLPLTKSEIQFGTCSVSVDTGRGACGFLSPSQMTRFRRDSAPTFCSGTSQHSLRTILEALTQYPVKAFAR